MSVPRTMMGRMYHPWNDLATRPDVRLIITELPSGLWGATDGNRVWLSKRLTSVERRCALTHELVHLDLGHDGHQDPSTERRVCHETARRLLTLRDVLGTAKWAPNTSVLAEELHVTPTVLSDFIDTLTPPETRIAASVLRAHWEGT